MLASMVEWDHSTEWSVANFTGKSRSGELVVDVDLSKEEYQYLAGHAIDGRVLFPATGYLVCFDNVIILFLLFECSFFSRH